MRWGDDSTFGCCGGKPSAVDPRYLQFVIRVHTTRTTTPALFFNIFCARIMLFTVTTLVCTPTH